MKFLNITVLSLICQFSYAESALQPPTVEYDYCNNEGTFCSKSETEYYMEDGKTIATVGGVAESNRDQLLNLDHFYRNKCMAELGLKVYESVSKSRLS